MPKGIPANGARKVRKEYAMTFREIAAEIGTSEQYARLLYDRGMKKIRSRPKAIAELAQVVRGGLINGNCQAP